MSVAEPADRSPYHGYRFPPEIIAHAVWLYFRFHLSFRDVQDLLAERGVVVSHETIRQWCTRFGATFAAGLRRRRVRAGDKWHCKNVRAGGGGHDPKWHWLPALVRMPCPGFVCPSLLVPMWPVLPLA
jgi:transposase-like protein